MVRIVADDDPCFLVYEFTTVEGFRRRSKASMDRYVPRDTHVIIAEGLTLMQAYSALDIPSAPVIKPPSE